ncbi:hypothetical protein FS842_007429 [Serendipita sp. 407]|nr:hypothetical protein FS842_007429 [Serendipita sp. 407]
MAQSSGSLMRLACLFRRHKLFSSFILLVNQVHEGGRGIPSRPIPPQLPQRPRQCKSGVFLVRKNDDNIIMVHPSCPGPEDYVPVIIASVHTSPVKSDKAYPASSTFFLFVLLSISK